MNKQSDTRIADDVFNLNSTNVSLDAKKINPTKSNLGFIVGGVFGFAGLAIVAFTTPFILPALRRHCLPYVPATDNQLKNLSKAFKKHANEGDTFIDIGSGDGRICRLAAKHRVFREIHGVELNYMLVLYSRLKSLRSGNFGYTRYFHQNLWRFPLHDYDEICIFGVESMMKPLEKYLRTTNIKPQKIIACRFPFETLKQIDVIGTGIDTVWVYRLNEKRNLN